MNHKMTVHEVSELTGVSVRALHYYDEIGLLPPTEVTEAGYRLYDEAALSRLQSILFFRELEFPLKQIRDILNSSDFDRNRALEQQITLLEMKKEHLQNLIDLARGMKALGVRRLDFTAFDTRKIDEYAKQAKESWGQTPEYKEFEQKSAGRTPEEDQKLSVEFMGFFAQFGEMWELSPSDEKVQAQVRKMQDFITEHLYTCSDKILLGLGKMYAGGGTISENIDSVGGEGTATFVAAAIEQFVMHNS